MGHQRRLADPTSSSGVAPNVDTLYSLAFLDLDGEPFTVRLPDFGTRYYSVQIGEADSSTAAVLGRRTHGPRVPEILIRRDNRPSPAPAGALVVACRSRFVMVAVRILVDPGDEHDLRTVVGLQDRIEVTGSHRPDPATPQSVAARNRADELHRPAAFLDSLEHACAGLPDTDIPAWVRRARHDLRAVLDDATLLPAIAHGLRDGLDAIEHHVKALGRTVNGWAINTRGTDFGDDHLLRAAVAYSQVYINPAEEALYPICEMDDRNEQLNGSREYRLTFAADRFPPVAFFWSLTVYHIKGLLYDNEIDRYAISDRTAGLRPNPDGSLTIHLQTARPTDPDANWLPCPPGDFRLMMRLYGVLDPTWSPPMVRRKQCD
ncbi:DUF1254 domain-containing protein [Nocardia farcinica]|nr:DUF1214 domain-containing protein [Nocardia farcinica]MBA4858383.1 DUF1254 domain-containing protein [Nocardia farcinica]